jgi:hypothetical protein
MTTGQTIDRCAGFAERLSACVRKDRRLAVRMVAWRIVLPILRRTVPVRTLVRWMTPDRSAASGVDARRQRLEIIRYFLARGGRALISTNCLERSLLLYKILAEVDAAPRLVLGVARDQAGVDGHAWVEIDGQALGDATTGRFVAVMLFEAGATGRPLREQCEHA